MMLEMLGCDVVIDAQRMSAIVRTESSANPFAVAVVGHVLSSQPTSLDQAQTLVNALKDKGLNYSIGLGQINQTNFSRYGITHENGFDVCTNLKVSSQILKACYDRFGSWGEAYSCYYSGNAVTGFRHGYVDKIYSALRLPVLTGIKIPVSESSVIHVTKRSSVSIDSNKALKPNKSPVYEIKQYQYQ
jgi:soluble lytic murein transglycosylase-like protein